MQILAAAASGGGQQGIYAVATAVGGVVVSIFTVYKNAQKQAQYTGENTGHIQSLSEQIGMLNGQLIELKGLNASLTTELRILKESHEAAQRRRPRDEDDYDPPAPRRRPRDEDEDDDYEPPKKRRPRYEDEDDEDYEPPRRKKTPPPPPARRKKK